MTESNYVLAQWYYRWGYKGQNDLAVLRLAQPLPYQAVRLGRPGGGDGRWSPTTPGGWIQVGVMSFGHGCGREPGIYTRLPSFIPDIVAALTADPVVPAGPPTVSAGVVNTVGSGVTQVSTSVDPNNLATTVIAEYGKTANLGSSSLSMPARATRVRSSSSSRIYRFCVEAFDQNGNKSEPSCARVRVT